MKLLAALLAAAMTATGCGSGSGDGGGITRARSPGDSTVPAPAGRPMQRSARLSGSLTFMLTAQEGDAVRRANLPNGQVRQLLQLPQGHALLSYALDATGRQMVVLESTGNVGQYIARLVRTRTGNRRVIRRAPTSTPYNRVAWSPDGRHVAFTRAVSSGDAIEVLDLRTARRRIFGRGAVDTLATPSWAPDSRRLAYINVAGDLRVVDTRSGADKAVDIAAQPIRDPSWHPREEKLAVATPAGIAVLDLASRSLTRLTTAPRSRFEDGPDNHPSWDPTGRSIAFVRLGAIYVVAATPGGEPKMVVEHPAQAPIFWRP